LDGGETFFYRAGNWTNKTGMCVSTTRGAALTAKFCEHHGRSPTEPEKVAPARRAPVRRTTAKPAAKKAPTKAEREKAKVVKAAIARALARRQAG